MDVGLVVLDGWGLADHDHLDAVRSADTHNFDRYREEGAFETLTASGRSGSPKYWPTTRSISPVATARDRTTRPD